jgi:surface protein
MFESCKELEYLDVSSFDTSNVTKMELMFGFCDKLKSIKGIYNFNTINCENMNSMFCECKELEYLDLSNFKTSNVTDMGWMFSKCFKLIHIIGITNFNTINVIKMNSMFDECKELEYLDLSNFNTSNVVDMSYMFSKCYKLKEIKGINKFNTSKVTNKIFMFQNCEKLNYSDIPSFKETENSNKLLINENNEKIFKKKKDIITFISTDKSINFPVFFEYYDIFSKVEKELYLKYPDLSNKNITFVSNGKEVNITSTLEENEIKNGDKILIVEN